MPPPQHVIESRERREMETHDREASAREAAARREARREKQQHYEKQQHDEKPQALVQPSLDQPLLEQLEGAGLEWSSNPFFGTPPMGVHVPPPDEADREKKFGKVGERSAERKLFRGLKRKCGVQYANLHQGLRLGEEQHLHMQAVHLANKERTLGFEYRRLLSEVSEGSAVVRVGGVPIGTLPANDSASSSAASSSAAPSTPASSAPAPSTPAAPPAAAALSPAAPSTVSKAASWTAAPSAPPALSKAASWTGPSPAPPSTLEPSDWPPWLSGDVALSEDADAHTENLIQRFKALTRTPPPWPPLPSATDGGSSEAPGEGEVALSDPYQVAAPEPGA